METGLKVNNWDALSDILPAYSFLVICNYTKYSVQITCYIILSLGYSPARTQNYWTAYWCSACHRQVLSLSLSLSIIFSQLPDSYLTSQPQQHYIVAMETYWVQSNIHKYLYKQKSTVQLNSCIVMNSYQLTLVVSLWWISSPLVIIYSAPVTKLKLEYRCIKTVRISSLHIWQLPSLTNFIPISTLLLMNKHTEAIQPEVNWGTSNIIEYNICQSVIILSCPCNYGIRAIKWACCVPDYCRHMMTDSLTGLTWSCQPTCWSYWAASESHSRQLDVTQSVCNTQEHTTTHSS